MSIIRCKKCGAELNFIEDASTVGCEYCGSIQTLTEDDGGNVIRVPSNNRYCGHDDLIAKIAKDIVNEAFSQVKPVRRKGEPNNTVVYSEILAFYIYEEMIMVRANQEQYFYFANYGMKRVNYYDLESFASAIEPFVMKYANDSAERIFGNIDERLGYSLKFDRNSVFGCQHLWVTIMQKVRPMKTMKSRWKLW